jgi:predicted MPP superfamily phosphohydrolase
MVLFFLIIFSLYGLVNLYIGVRGWQLLDAAPPWRIAYLALFLFLVFSYIAGRFLERASFSLLSEALVWIGSYWLAAMLYFFLFLLLIDLTRLVLVLLPLIPADTLDLIRTNRNWLLLSIVGVVVALLAIGHWNAATARVRPIELRISKRFNGGQPLKIAVASDIHLGTIIGRARLDRIVETINGLDPDLVLFPGDIVDEDLGPVIGENLGESLRSITSRLGVFAVTGNHEYIGGVDAACHYLGEHGITILRDTTTILPNGLQLIGREDRARRQFAGMLRKPLGELMRGIDPAKPVILLDHQPFGLDEAAQAGVDLQLSGHTHHGQIWPINFITQAIYELSWGYLRVGATHIYVSSGVGTWGPPVRLGNSPEIVLISLREG